MELPLHDRSEKELRLYDYQADAVEQLRDGLRRGVTTQILCAPTGSGKTVIATYMIRASMAKDTRSMFVVDRTALVDQTSATFDAYGIPHGVIQGNHWRWRPYEQVQIASAQTLARRSWPSGMDLVIVDEAHTVHKKVVQQIKACGVPTIGLSATPFTRGLGQIYRECVTVTTTNRLIDDGKLAPYRIFAPSEPDMTGAKVSAGEWTAKEAGERSMSVVGDCVEHYIQHAMGRKFIAFGSTIAHCEELQRQFLAAGINVALYTSDTNDEVRSEVLSEYRKRDSAIRGLVSVAALSKGFDVEDVSCIIVARPLRSSLAEHIQIIGRGLRRDPHDPDKDCVILDHAGNTMRLGDEMAEFFATGEVVLDDGKKKPKKDKKELDEEKKMRKCPKCSLVHAYAPSCPNCGHEYPKRVIVHENGKLAELVGGGEARRQEHDVYAMLLHIAQQRGYKEGWAKHQFREITGKWPSRIAPHPIPPNRHVHGWVQSRLIAYRKAKAKAKG